MSVYRKESERIKKIHSFIKFAFPRFGVNKNQEIARLLYEISKRENTNPASILNNAHYSDFHAVKKELIERRFPVSSLSGIVRPHLPKIEFISNGHVGLRKRRFYPKNIFVERKVSNSFLLKRFKNIFPKARISEIKSLKDYSRNNRALGIRDYNRRQDTVFIAEESHDFFKKCPCTKYAVGCGYHIFNLGFGCLFECNYCYLQEYTNSPGIILPANIEIFFEKFNLYREKGMRLGTGEFTDSLALDHFTQYSIPIIEYFKKQKDVVFEFKTKSTEIKNLLKYDPMGRIAVSWSLNPKNIIKENEFFTPSLKKRLDAARMCKDAGYRIGFHFDPVIYYRGWENDYSAVIENMFNKVKPRHIAWISLGTFRFAPRLKQIIEKRFPQNKILDEELIPGYDNKLRYPYKLRYEIYKEILQMLFKHSRKLKVYLCMEESAMWKELKLTMPNLCK